MTILDLTPSDVLFVRADGFQQLYSHRMTDKEPVELEPGRYSWATS